MTRKLREHQIRIAFREDIIGDSEGSKDFYLKVTPVVKVRDVHWENVRKALIQDALEAIRKEGKKKGIIK